MSEAQVATPEQEAQAQQFIEQAKQQAMQEIQQNLAVQANEPGTDPATIAKTASVFLEFLKKGTA
jgi:hypothetical protein